MRFRPISHFVIALCRLLRANSRSSLHKLLAEVDFLRSSWKFCREKEGDRTFGGYMCLFDVELWLNDNKCGFFRERGRV